MRPERKMLHVLHPSSQPTVFFFALALTWLNQQQHFACKRNFQVCSLELYFLRYPLTPICAELQKNPVEGFSAGLNDDSNIYEWDIMIMGPPFVCTFCASSSLLTNCKISTAETLTTKEVSSGQQCPSPRSTQISRQLCVS